MNQTTAHPLEKQVFFDSATGVETLRVLHEKRVPGLASVFVAQLSDGARVEMVESVQPPIPASQKWVNIVSVLRGCPVRCPFCDAGRGRYTGKVSADEMLAQIDFLVQQRFADGTVPVHKWKIQFARMGDPAFNHEVLRVIEQVPKRFRAPGFYPSISTIAPASCEDFFEDMLDVKRRMGFGGRFQLQFSLHTTCEETRRRLIPARTWTFSQMGAYGKRWHEPKERKITLNFALPRDVPFAPRDLLPHFPPEHFLIKVTPVNPTASSVKNGICGSIDPCNPSSCEWIDQACREAGYECILSIGELAENEVGSNCGMYLGEM